MTAVDGVGDMRVDDGSVDGNALSEIETEVIVDRCSSSAIEEVDVADMEEVVIVEVGCTIVVADAVEDVIGCVCTVGFGGSLIWEGTDFEQGNKSVFIDRIAI